MWSIVWTATVVFVVGCSCSPVDIVKPSSELLPPLVESGPEFAPTSDSLKGENVPTPATDLVPPEVDTMPTLATDLVPPKIDEPANGWADSPMERNVSATLFVINIFSIKNHTAEDENDVLHDDVMEEVPNGTIQPLAMFLLIVEDRDEDHPVSLDEVAKDLEDEGFVVEKVEKEGETRLVKIDLGSIETMVKTSAEEEKALSNAIDRVANELEKKHEDDDEDEASTPSIEDHGKLMKIRRKRHLCLKCKLDELKQRKYGGGCGGGCGGGNYYAPAQYQPVQVVAVPVYGGYQKPQGGYYPQPQPYYPQAQPCNTCGAVHQPSYNHGGGGNSFAQASAQASASAQSW